MILYDGKAVQWFKCMVLQCEGLKSSCLQSIYLPPSKVTQLGLSCIGQRQVKVFQQLNNLCQTYILVQVVKATLCILLAQVKLFKILLLNMTTNMCDMVFATKDEKTTNGRKNVFDSTTITCSWSFTITNPNIGVVIYAMFWCNVCIPLSNNP